MIPIKLFGIENLWGGGCQLIDGFGCDSAYNLYAATNNFNDSLYGYTIVGTFNLLIRNGFMKEVVGSSEAGFIPYPATNMNGGSSSTYYCDNIVITNGFTPAANSTPAAGGSNSSDEYSGIFAFSCTYSTKVSPLYTVFRLSYY